ncbi:MAG TPA: hypothetical protein VHB77_20615, partial [Planctomycetaceae bacterium]|nr:hypothetical protein [Planctomycetaceae bacterium]
MAGVKNSRVALGVERVEDRLVLTASAVDASFASGTLTLMGDNNNDSFSVKEVLVGHGKSAVHELLITGNHHTTLTSSDKSLTVDAHGNILVPSADAVSAISIMLGTGNNNVQISKLTTLAPLSLTVTDSGSTGNNSVMINGVNGETSVGVTLGSGKDSLIMGGSSIGALTATLSSSSKT